MKIILDKRFKDHAKGIFGKYSFEVGILEDKPHKQALGFKKFGLKDYLGGPARKTGRKDSGETVADVSKANRLRTNYLTAPFKKRTSEIIKFSKEFFRLCFGHTESKRLINYLQAIVRNPILRGDYGHNSALTKKIKGFDRVMIDTGQLFKNIKARINRV